MNKEQTKLEMAIHALDRLVAGDYYARRAARALRIELIAMYVIAGEA